MTQDDHSEESPFDLEPPQVTPAAAVPAVEPSVQPDPEADAVANTVAAIEQIEADLALDDQGAEPEHIPEAGLVAAAVEAAELDEAAEPGADAESDSAAERDDADEQAADDLEAALAEATANLEAESTLDDIAPGTIAPDAEPDALEPTALPSAKDTVSIWPFVIYDVLWLAYAGALVWKFEQLPAGQAVFESPLYQTAVLAGVGLTVLGPVLIFATWFGSWGREGASKGALFISALIRGALATTAGVAMWWIALLVLDQLRLGRLL